MNYFTRPKLANKALTRLTKASIRGNVRRHDADGNVSSPYFPNASAGQNITVTSDTGSVTYQLTSNTLLSIITGLNSGSVLPNIGARAFDSDGCIGLSSNTEGSTSYIAVTGGTAAKGLGFDLGAQAFTSRGGDISGASEGRLGVTFGSAIPNPGENLSAMAVSRGLARIAANTDILYSDLLRLEVVIKKIGTYTNDTGASVSSIDLSGITSAGQRFYTGGQVAAIPASGLPVGAAASEIRRYYYLIDTVTGKPSICNVTGVTNGATSILGVEQTVLASTAITSIPNGYTIEVDSVDFISSGVQVGDYVRISSATNNTPWSNNGYRWAVDKIVDNTHIQVRPLSASELYLCGESYLPEAQPIIELNSTGAGLGNITILRGPWTAGVVHIDVAPSIPVGAVYEVWAPVPVSKHGSGVFEVGATSGLASASNVLDTNSAVPDGILSPVIGFYGGPYNFTTSAFYVGYKGRTIYVPASAITTPNGTAAIVGWDFSTKLVAVLTTANQGFPLAVINSSGNLQGIISRAGDVRSMVFNSGLNEEQDFVWVMSMAIGYAYAAPNFTALAKTQPITVLVHSDQTIDVPFSFNLSNSSTCPPFTIRGATGRTKLINSNTTDWFNTGNYTTGVHLENLEFPHGYTSTINVRDSLKDVVVGTTEYVYKDSSFSIVRDRSTNLTKINLVRDWTSLTLGSGWTSSGLEPLQYCKDALGFVHLRGRVSGTNGGTAVAISTLPSGFRPISANQYAVVHCIESTAYVPAQLFIGMQGDPHAGELLFSLRGVDYTGSIVYGFCNISFYAG